MSLGGQLRYRTLDTVACRRHAGRLLKIDRSFIDGLSSEPGDRAIVSSILSLAYAMGKRTIAEGGEKRELMAALANKSATTDVALYNICDLLPAKPSP
ncbi:hypothetical protein [Bradyrhizobium sp. LB11.1]|uniref:hypothetical protein n=1 Tax=Bradyrhizobium sp. LB11.1 TaxID=3156326 RepID=UPI003397BDD1